ncbi:unnamed protein product [Xylocopa violacea]|uniref:Uncharacterized protein n=1 Tax=Xylocopa violacea TaxID=135666 RepID=A0ABP1PFK8_XYLVO
MVCLQDTITNIIEQNNVLEDKIEENYNANQQSNLEFSLENQHCKRKLEPPWIEQMYSVLKDTIFNRVSEDECAIFAEHITMKLRTYSSLTKNAVEHQIHNILYKADIGKFENQYKPSTSTQTQK